LYDDSSVGSERTDDDRDTATVVSADGDELGQDENSIVDTIERINLDVARRNGRKSGYGRTPNDDGFEVGDLVGDRRGRSKAPMRVIGITPKFVDVMIGDLAVESEVIRMASKNAVLLSGGESQRRVRVEGGSRSRRSRGVGTSQPPARERTKSTLHRGRRVAARGRGTSTQSRRVPVPKVTRSDDSLETAVADLDAAVDGSGNSYSLVTNDSGYKYGDAVEVIWDKEDFCVFGSRRGKPSRLEGKVGRVVGHTKCFVWVMMEPIGPDADVVQKRSHNVKKVVDA